MQWHRIVMAAPDGSFGDSPDDLCPDASANDPQGVQRGGFRVLDV
jgi:hypothetical protein